VAATLPVTPYNDRALMDRSQSQGRPPAARRQNAPWADALFSVAFSALDL